VVVGLIKGGILGPPAVSGRVFGLHVSGIHAQVLVEGVTRYQAIARDIPACGGSVPASHSDVMQGIIWPCHVLDQGWSEGYVERGLASEGTDVRVMLEALKTCD
jgi:hypothetical protein